MEKYIKASFFYMKKELLDLKVKISDNTLNPYA
jgi:hypothetical protein